MQRVAVHQQLRQKTRANATEVSGSESFGNILYGHTRIGEWFTRIVRQQWLHTGRSLRSLRIRRRHWQRRSRRTGHRSRRRQQWCQGSRSRRHCKQTSRKAESQTKHVDRTIQVIGQRYLRQKKRPNDQDSHRVQSPRDQLYGKQGSGNCLRRLCGQLGPSSVGGSVRGAAPGK